MESSDPPPKQDPAGDPEYDGKNGDSGSGKKPNKRDLDKEILSRRILGRWMSIGAVFAMGVFIVTFFCYAIIYAHSFIKTYQEHIHSWIPAGSVGDAPSVLPLVVPMMPAVFFSVLGLATLITCIRFITAYVNAQEDQGNDSSVIERISREVASIIRAVKSGGSD